MYSMNSTKGNYSLQLKMGTISILDDFIAARPLQAIPLELSTLFLREINVITLEMQIIWSAGLLKGRTRNLWSSLTTVSGLLMYRT